jgi:tetratricopeptide (TPR) repeat protein
MSTPDTENVLELGQRWQVHLKRGVRSLEAGQLDRAARHFAAAYRLAPDRPEVCLALGREYLRRGQLAQAEPLLRRAWEGNPGLAVAAAALARLLGVGRSDLKAAYAILDEGDRRHPDHPLLIVVRGELQLEEDDWVGARRSFERARDLGAENHAVRSGLARTYNAEGIAHGEQRADERAIFAFKRACDLDPTWSGPFVNLGVVFARLGRPRRARTCYEKAAALEPDNPVAHFNLGNLLREAGDLEGARDCYERVVDLSPDYPGARSSLADVLADRGEYDRAIELYREALVGEPERVPLWGNLGLALIARGDEGEGEECLRRALDLDPHSFHACCNLAALLICQGRYAEAARFARRAKEIDPEKAKRWFSEGGEGKPGPLAAAKAPVLPLRPAAPAPAPERDPRA